MLSSLRKKLRDLLLEPLVDVLRAADEPHRREAVAPRLESLLGRGDDVGVVGQAEVVVGAEVDDLAAVDRDAGPLRRFDPPFGLVEPLRLEALESPCGGRR